MTWNGVTALILRFFADFDFFAGQIRCSGWTYIVRKYCLSVPVFHFWPLLTHPAMLSLCDSWTTCYICVLLSLLWHYSWLPGKIWLWSDLLYVERDIKLCLLTLWLFYSQQKGDVDEQKSPAAIPRQVMTRFHRSGSVKFPKLEDCAHFHYDFVSIGNMQVTTAASRSCLWLLFVQFISRNVSNVSHESLCSVCCALLSVKQCSLWTNLEVERLCQLWQEICHTFWMKGRSDKHLTVKVTTSRYRCPAVWHSDL